VKELKPVSYDRNGAMWDREEVRGAVAENIKAGDRHLNISRKNMQKTTKEAKKEVDAFTGELIRSIENMSKKQKELEEVAKKASGSVRRSARDLSDGLIKIQKEADFDKLERYTELLERCASAMDSLAKLEKSGTLEKIASAIR